METLEESLALCESEPECLGVGRNDVTKSCWLKTIRSCGGTVVSECPGNHCFYGKHTDDTPTMNPSAHPSSSIQTTSSPMLDEGSICSTDDACDSSRCNLAEFPPRCREKNVHSGDCTKNSDCQSDVCLGLTCVDGRENDRCHSNDDCESGRCAFSVPFGTCQSRAEHGEKCIRDNDCLSEHCLLFTCSDKRNGAHCVNDNDCVTGSSCVWGAHGGTCKVIAESKCGWWNWDECSEPVECSWLQAILYQCE